MKTTLNKIRACSPCASGWTKLLKNLGKKHADDEPLAITTILDSNGLDDTLWCLRAVDGCQKEMRLYAVDCARSVQHLLTDTRSISAIDVAERCAHGLATDDELSSARDAAGAAAGDAARGPMSVKNTSVRAGAVPVHVAQLANVTIVVGMLKLVAIGRTAAPTVQQLPSVVFSLVPEATTRITAS